jgi:hypothetical protein
LAFDFARAENAGADAIAYWHAVHIWLSGGDPFLNVVDPTQASGRILPYVYPPWTIVLFLPWALLPWDIAWALWRWIGVLFFAWTIKWAWERRPLGTAVVLAMLGPAIAANFDTGNVNIYLALAIWAAQFVRTRMSGLIWAFCANLKWLPAAAIFVLSPRARGWGLVFLAYFTVLTLATWPQTLEMTDVVFNFPRPLRLDYLMLLWAAVPWLWRQPWPPWWLQSGEIVRHWRERPPVATWLRRYFGLQQDHP